MRNSLARMVWGYPVALWTGWVRGLSRFFLSRLPLSSLLLLFYGALLEGVYSLQSDADATLVLPLLSSVVHSTPPQKWAAGFGAPPRFPFVGDADADGYADLICLYPLGNGIIDVGLNVQGQKGVYFQARREFGQNGIGAVGGEFAGSKGIDVLALFSDGALRLAHTLNPKEQRYEQDELVGKFPTPLQPPIRLVSSDLDGNGRDEVVLVEAKGKAWLITLSEQSPPKANLKLLGTLATQPNGLAMIDLEGDGRTELIYLDREGGVWAVPVSGARLGKRKKLLQAQPNLSICGANLDGNPRPELVVGTQIIWNGDPKQRSEWKQLASSEPGILCAGDMNGDKRDDLIRFRRGSEPHTGYDILVYFTYRLGDPDPDSDGLSNEEEWQLGSDWLNRDTDRDGLLDGWEVKGIRGLDLPGLGCSPLHRDVICELQRLETVDEERLRQGASQVKAFFASLRVPNPDGKRGINFIPIMREPIPKGEAEGKGWVELGAQFHPQEHRGITHWMVVNPGGGGQAQQMGDRGGCGIDAFYATFIHEFGHQLGLDHTGFWGPGHCPIYTSLMNYAYSYSFDERPEAIHYSYGTFKSLVLNERNLSEIIPYPLRYVAFLGKAPYYYRLKADGDRTLIDWNWNGIFGEDGVRADINYAYSTNAGVRQTLDKTLTAPFLVVHREKQLLFYGKKSDAGETMLVYRSYRGNQLWSDPVVIESRGLRGDPIAASDGESIWVFYPIGLGVRYQRIILAGEKEVRREAGWLPESTHRQATPCFYKGRLYVFLWQGADQEVLACWRTPRGWSQVQPLGFKSKFPVGVTVDPLKNELLVGCGQDQDAARPSRWQVRRFQAKPEGDLFEVEQRWIEGEGGSARGSTRPVLVFENSRDAGPAGRLHFFGGGIFGENTPWACIYVAQQIADRSVRDGWLVKRNYDEWTQSRSAPAAAWFQNDIVYAYRWVDGGGGPTDNDLHVAYYGLGLDLAPMSDHDDVGFIAHIGLQTSILFFGTTGK